VGNGFCIVVQYKDVDEEFSQRVTENTRRYIGIFAEVINELTPEPTEAYTVDEDRDILMMQHVDEGSMTALMALTPVRGCHQR
jgi:hypothetical protein